MSSFEELYAEHVARSTPTPYEFFTDALEDCISGEEFHYRCSNSVIYNNGVMRVYDTILANDSVVLIARVNYDGYLQDITKIQEQMRTLKIDSPYYKNHKMYGCIATFNMTTEVRNAALAAGLLVLVRDKEALDKKKYCGIL
jgi:hypothetical protein